MHLLIWMLTLVCTTVHGISRISQPGFKAVNFARAIEGRKLNGSVIKEVEVESESSCRLQCVEEERCQSYNFATTKNDAGRYKCELSDSDRFFGHVNFTANENFSYRGIKSVCESNANLCGDKEVCIPYNQAEGFKCNCIDGFAGQPCKLVPMSCAQLLQDGFTSSGVYTINPDGGKPIQVLCDMTTDGGGWTVFQRRLDGYVDFYLEWESYKNGFGDLNGEFWLGNDNLHRLTAADDVMLRVDLEDFDGNIRYAEYTTFKVADEEDKYRLLIGEYSGTAGDSMYENIQSTNGMQFSTRDNDNDLQSENCAVKFKGAWWYRNCHWSNLNGLYHGGQHDSFADGINWKTWRGHYYSLKRTEMKLRPVSQN
ncbi:hypothetical protein ACROYT_G004321 [Oculina patagonica]